METLTVQFLDPMMYDRLHTLAVEYDLSTDILVSLAVKRLLNDVDLVRNLRVGRITL